MIQSSSLRDLLVMLATVSPALAGPTINSNMLPEHTEMLARHLGIEARDGPCDPYYMEGGKSVDSCPKKFKAKDGVCEEGIPNTPDKDRKCNGYCEETITMEYGQEQYWGVECRPGNADPCTLSEGTSLAETKGHSINIEINGNMKKDEQPLQAGFSVGASWFWQTTVTNTVTKGFAHKENPDRPCGHFSFVPFMIKSCGILSQGKEKSEYSPGGYTGISTGGTWHSSCDKGSIETQKDWCNTVTVNNQDLQSADKNNKGVAGTTIFVYKDCKTNQPLAEGQDPIYYFPGVARGLVGGKPDTAIKSVVQD